MLLQQNYPLLRTHLVRNAEGAPGTNQVPKRRASRVRSRATKPEDWAQEGVLVTGQFGSHLWPPTHQHHIYLQYARDGPYIT
jgi:hypothetical protein